jgi:hypothetical protein
MANTAIAFSGGGDSTYVLYRLLNDTTDNITAILFEKPENQNVKLNIYPPSINVRINSLVARLKQIRNFTFERVTVTNANITSDTDHYHLFFINYFAQKINNGQLDRLVTGRSWEQYDQVQIAGKQGTPTDYAMVNLFNKICTRGEIWQPLVTHDYHQKYNRLHLLKNLPSDIIGLTVSCANPILNSGKTDVSDCGKCFKCLWDTKVKQLIAQGWNAAQIDTWRKLKSLQYGGGNGLTAPIRYWIGVEMGRDFFPGLDTKQKVMQKIQTEQTYILNNRDLNGVWKIE